MKKESASVFLVTISALMLLVTGCVGSKLTAGDEAFQRGEYFEAQKFYRQAYDSFQKKDQRNLKGEAAFKSGLCYDKLGMSARAAVAFRNALRYDYADSLAYLYLGNALMEEGKYPEAIKSYESYLAFHPDDAYAKEAIKGCRLAMNETPTRYVVRQVKTFNSTRSDYSPMFQGDDHDLLYFTSNREKATGDGKSGITGQKNGDIFMSHKDEKNEWTLPVPVMGEINTEADEGTAVFSPDGQTMYFSRARRSESQNTTVEIFKSERNDATWNEAERLEIFGDSLYSAGQPAVSADGHFLYFVSDRPGGYGGLDIWRITLNGEKPYPVNMGPHINTPGNEMFPYSRSDSLFYFSSDGHPGYGGLDIFKARMDASGEFWSVENLGQPVNSKADDFGIVFDSGEKGYFSSNRNDVRGYDNIYSFELPRLQVSISGLVSDRDGEPVPDAVIRIVGDDGSNQKDISRSDGSFRFSLSPGVKYVMKAGANGYLNMRQSFETDSLEEDAHYEVDFLLSALNKPQVIENIFYDFDKATLRPESREALDELVVMMDENPHVAIEFSAHTDRKGSREYNQKLSERRAKSVVDYLIDHGIEPGRLTYKGYGKEKPKTVTKRIHGLYPQFEEGTLLDEEFVMQLPPDEMEMADQINRRTEFMVISVSYDLF